jgi:hypothetical protein
MAVTIEEVTAEVPREAPAPGDERAPTATAASPDALLRQLQQQLALQAERAARASAD